MGVHVHVHHGPPRIRQMQEWIHVHVRQRHMHVQIHMQGVVSWLLAGGSCHLSDQLLDIEVSIWAPFATGQWQTVR